MGPRRSRLALLLTVLTAVFRAGSSVPKCEQCSSPIDASLCAAPVCIKGGPPVPSPSGCKTLTCPKDEFFIISPPPSYTLGEVHDVIETITCNDRKEWNTEANELVKKAVCVKEISCHKKNPMLSDCTAIDLKYECDPFTLSNDDEVKPCPTGKNLFVQVVGSMKWEYTSKIRCASTTGTYMRSAVNHKELSIGTTEPVICAISNPSNPPETCQASVRVKSTCGDSPKDGCVAVTAFPDDKPLSCSQLPEQFLYLVDASGQWTYAEKIECDVPNKQWKQGADGKNLLKADDNVICGDCKAPRFTPTLCDTNWDATIGCKEMLVFSQVDCGAQSRTLYFLKGVNTKWMPAKSVKCEGDKRYVEYVFGTESKKEEFNVGDKVICALTNPTPKACSIRRFSFADNKEQSKYEVATGAISKAAGESATCDNEYKYLACTGVDDSNKCIESVSPYIPPVCGPDGLWKVNDAKDAVSVMCGRRKCVKCVRSAPAGSVPPGVEAILDTDLASPPVLRDTVEECRVLDCQSANRMFAIRLDVDDPSKYRFYADAIICDDNEEWKDKNGNKVEKAQCVQSAFMTCHNPKTYLIDTTCPSEFGESCTPIALPDSDANKWKPLVCGKKILTRKNPVVPNDHYWDELSEIKCDSNVAKWSAKFVGEIEARHLDYQNTIICAEHNPNPRPAPITTTTAAPIEICELCQEQLKNESLIKCEKGGISCLVFERQNINKTEKCIMKPQEGFSLIITDNSLEVDYLECKRPVFDDDGIMPKPTWTTKDDKPVTSASTRREVKQKKWQPLSYGIVAGTLLLIGGMGLGCVLIYFRMRKKPSVREKKKKERGVTKKYTSANVVKTGGRSGGGSREGGESREPTKSVNESNLEDAPTLKL